MLINDYIKEIKKLKACAEALEDALNYETSQELWDKCKRGDWMLWLIGRLSGEVGDERRKQLVLTACKCARLSLRYVQEGELRPLRAIEAAEQWARGGDGITLEDVISAANAASAAHVAYAAVYGAAYAANAAYAAAHATAHAAANAANAAASAVYAAYAANAAYATANNEVLKQCAGIVRADYPNVDDLFRKDGLI